MRTFLAFLILSLSVTTFASDLYDLRKAITDGSLKKIKKILRSGEIDLNSIFTSHYSTQNNPDPTPDRHSLLSYAIMHKKNKVVSLLLNEGIDPSLAGGKALNFAVKRNNIKLMKKLIKHKVDIDGTQKFFAIYDRFELVPGNPLRLAIAEGHLEFAEILLQHNARTDFKGHYFKNSPMSEAAVNGDLEAILLLKKYNSELYGWRDSPLFLLPFIYGQKIENENKTLEIIKFYQANGGTINEIGSQGHNLIHRAVRAGTTKILEYAISEGVDVNKENDFGETPLYVALKMSPSVNADKFEVVKTLLNAGANPNGSLSVKDKNILHESVGRGYLKIAKLLLNFGANPKLNNEDGDNLFFSLIEYTVRNKLEIGKLLVKHGVDFREKNSKGETVIEAAIKKPHSNNGDLVEYLKKL